MTEVEPCAAARSDAEPLESFSSDDDAPAAAVVSLSDERKLTGDARKEARRARKAAAKAAKKSRNEKGRKPCERCEKPEREVLIRCSCKEWEGWRLVCGPCWRDVSGGVPDGDAAHPDYRYGGLWRFRKGSKDKVFDGN